MKYDPEWMMATLADLKDFSEANDMPCASRILAVAIKVAQLECAELATPEIQDQKPSARIWCSDGIARQGTGAAEAGQTALPRRQRGSVN